MKKCFLLVTLMCLLAATISYAQLGGTVGLDQTFNGSGYQIQSFSSDGAYGASVALQSDGRIVVGGTQLVSSNIGDYAAMRLLPTGGLDNAFDLDGRVTTSLGPFDISSSLVIQPDGKIVLGGERYSGTSNNDFAAVRYNSDGTLDNSFDLNGIVATNRNGFSDEHSYGMALQTDGKLVLVGTTAFATMPGENFPSDLMIVRYNPDGSLDSTFSGTGILVVSFQNVSESANAVVIQPDGKILIGGYLFNGFKNDFLMMRFVSNGMLDTSFGTGGLVISSINGSNNSISTLAIQADGKIIAGGSVTNGSALVRYHSSGNVDTTFGNGGVVNVNQSIAKIIIRNDAKILVGGSVGARFAVSRYVTNGSADPTFNNGQPATPLIPHGQCIGSSMALQNDGKMLIVGTCFNPNVSQISMVVARLVETRNDGPFDFDGDGKTDVGIYRAGGGEWWWQRSSDGVVPAVQFGLSTDVIAPGDFTGDGKLDHAFFRPSDGFWNVLRSEDFTYYAFPFGTAGDVPVTGDYDGDGKADVAVFRPSSSTWFIARSSDGGTTITGFGAAGDVPVTADYDGDGKDDIAIYRPNGATGGEWWINRSTAGLLAMQFGSATDKTVPGDYTGDGKADVAFWRPSTGEWYILRSEDSSFYAFPFGQNGDIPAPGDYDGDGKMDAAVFRPAEGIWYIAGSTTGTQIIGFGIPGDRPIPNTFVR